MKLIDTIIEHITDNMELELREMARKLLHHYGFVKVKSRGDMEVYSNMDEKYNLTVRISNFHLGNGSVLVGRIIYRGPKKDSPNEIGEIDLGIHPIHPNDKAFPHELNYAVRYVKSIKDNNEIEPYSTDSENMWNNIMGV
jgi:hypothetical protein